MQFDLYTWIFALATIAAFACAFGVGANDLANSFASSVGAKALTMGQAVLVAAVCEFLGALLLGASVTDTVRSKIVALTEFTATPELLMYGFLCAMIAAAFWDNLACYLELPVSTTHTTVAAIVGMSIVMRGGDSVVWSEHQAAFPYIDGMLVVFLSWVVSPLVSGIFAIILFGLIRTFVLRSHHSFIRALWILPFLMGLTFFVVTVFVIQTGNKNGKWDPVSDLKAVCISIGVGCGFGLLGFLATFYMKRTILHEDKMAEQRRQKALEEGHAPLAPSHAGAVRPAQQDVVSPDGKSVAESLPAQAKDVAIYHGMANNNSANASGAIDKVWNHIGEVWRRRVLSTKLGRAIFANRVMQVLTYGVNYNTHAILDEEQTVFDAKVANIWMVAEVFDPRTERVFRYLQVFTAMAMSFAHGSNDVANAIGPYSAVYAIWSTGKVPTQTSVEDWILALGGAGIVVGLATYGYKIIRVLGVKSVKVTNARGFCLELATAITVILASRYGLPVSTTQVITGAVLAVGLFEGAKGVNWRMFARIFLGWVMTLVVAGTVAGALTAWGVYSPSKVMADDAVFVNKALNAQTLKLIKEMNTTTGIGASVMSQLQGFNKTLTAFYKSAYNFPPAVEALHAQVFYVFDSRVCHKPTP
ncbi:hypothetical protein WJX72_011509 [[Myrmecia] bisecta]|uniref:Phosphate transporter n=1 Tax=[Myrmecia] bisecta TaxID=41462 RepID=A0AAW1R9Y0_9CHLO